MLSKQEQADNEHIANLSLTDQINLSTVSLIFYQSKSVKRELLANDKNIDAYEPSFGIKITEAFKFGWMIMQALFLLVVRLWFMFLLALITIFIIRYFRNKKKNKNV